MIILNKTNKKKWAIRLILFVIVAVSLFTVLLFFLDFRGDRILSFIFLYIFNLLTFGSFFMLFIPAFAFRYGHKKEKEEYTESEGHNIISEIDNTISTANLIVKGKIDKPVKKDQARIDCNKGYAKGITTIWRCKPVFQCISSQQQGCFFFFDERKQPVRKCKLNNTCCDCEYNPFKDWESSETDSANKKA